MTAATSAIRFLGSLEVPEGPLSGQRLELAPFQKRYVRGARWPKAPALRRASTVSCLRSETICKSILRSYSQREFICGPSSCSLIYVVFCAIS